MISIQPVDSDWRLANEVYRRFRSLPGSKHIASRFALAHLSALIREHRPAQILEIGAGIGTMTYMLLKHPNFKGRIICTETNDFCLRSLEKNIPAELKRRLVVVREFGHLVREVGELWMSL